MMLERAWDQKTLTKPYWAKLSSGTLAFPFFLKYVDGVKIFFLTQAQPMPHLNITSTVNR